MVAVGSDPTSIPLLQSEVRETTAGHPLRQQFPTCILQEFLKPALPDYVVRGTDSFPLHCQVKKNDKSTKQ